MKRSKYLLLIILLLLSLTLVGCNKKDNKKQEQNVENEQKKDYRMTGNDLQRFDLFFLKLENKEENKVYSPLSIKYALEMLAEGANGETKEQLDAVIGDYVARKYTNSKNMSFANALFIKDSYKDEVKSEYIDTLKEKYYAEVMFDSFKNPTTVNNWVSDKTFELIDNLMDDHITDLDYIIINALAIDMEWVNKIQPEEQDYVVRLEHEQYKNEEDPEWPYHEIYVPGLSASYYTELKFKGTDKKAKAVQIAATANRYDAVKTIGEDNIRKTVKKEYDKWVEETKKEAASNGYKLTDSELAFDMDEYIKELNSNYKHVSSSTDFQFYDDSDVKVFAKDLKEYDGLTLQYIGIMPKEQSLVDFIDKKDAKDIDKYINSLKTIELDSFEDGYLTIVSGTIPMFKMEYELDFIKDLNKLGIVNAFDSKKAELTNISSGSYISEASHKANIEFSNDGIKAGAATSFGGAGAADGGFNYYYEVPVKKIDLTFDKPFMYLVRDKSTGEVWFTGTTYEPVEYTALNYDMY